VNNEKYPLDFLEIRQRARRPWGGALKSHRCFCCGSGLRLSNHHIRAREDGGDDSPRNKVTVCSVCHDAVEGMEWPKILERRESIRCTRLTQTEPKAEADTKTLEEYFALRRSPSSGSPVGALMVRVLEKNPGMGFDAACYQAKALLQKAAGKWKYRVPTVYSPEETEKRRESLRTAFTPLAKAA
jgi:HNH endonuclease